MAIGLLVFLLMLVFAVHLMLYLHLSAVAADAALAGAHALAMSDDPGSESAATDADRRATVLLGDAFASGTNRVDPADADYVVYRVEVKPIGLLGIGAWANRPITRSARVRIEAVR